MSGPQVTRRSEQENKLYLLHPAGRQQFRAFTQVRLMCSDLRKGEMKKMKKIIPVLLSVLLLSALTACGSKGPAEINTSADTESTRTVTEEKTGSVSEQTENGTTAASEPAQETASAAETAASESAADVLVVYFSATGNTKGVAEKIAAITGGDLYEIKAAQEYTDADLDWNDSDSRTTKEQNDSSIRPEIGSESVSFEGYSTIYIGYPIWWGEEPRIMDTFVESYSFDGITVIPFCTSSSSGIGRSGQNLADNAGSGTWLDGKRFGAGASEDEVKSWIEELQ